MKNEKMVELAKKYVESARSKSLKVKSGLRAGAEVSPV
jgi:hypothetical protein